MVMKVVKEDISKILARADITESTQWLSAKKRKRGVFILKSGLVQWIYLVAVHTLTWYADQSHKFSKFQWNTPFMFTKFGRKEFLLLLVLKLLLLLLTFLPSTSLSWQWNFLVLASNYEAIRAMTITYVTSIDSSIGKVSLKNKEKIELSC